MRFATWGLDGGGPNEREKFAAHLDGGFLYGISPTDVPVLTRWAKVLILVQSMISLTTVALLAARAVNIL